jgi:retron-type reverse transcriptase
MSELLGRLGVATLLPQRELELLIRSAPHRYKVYQIRKRTPGQYRTIAQPAREVKDLQRWVMKHVLAEFEAHPSATAYRKGLSTLDNAKPHAPGRFLLKMDFKDFFPSLKARDFRTFLRRRKSSLTTDEIKALCLILFWMPKHTTDLRLSIGAPSSPMLSNILMFEFDRYVAALCASHNVAYTRYADDLSFSAEVSERLQAVEKAVIDWCSQSKSPVLTVHQSKTVRVSKSDLRRVTGLVLTNDRRVSLGRETKRLIRAGVHHFVTGKLPPDETLKLRGMLAYVNSVEPTFLRRLRKKYGADQIQRCLEWKAGG